MILGNKVCLRHPGGSFLNDVVDDTCNWRNDPDIKAFFFEEEPISYDAQARWLDKITDDPYKRFYIIDALTYSTGAPYDTPPTIGTIGLNHIDWRSRTAELSWFLIGEVKFRSWGYGKEALFLLLDHAFNHLNLHRVWLETMLLNEAAQRVYQKLGFQSEGILREHKYKTGRYIDVYLYGLLLEVFRTLEEPLREELGLVKK